MVAAEGPELKRRALGWAVLAAFPCALLPSHSSAYEQLSSHFTCDLVSVSVVVGDEAGLKSEIEYWDVRYEGWLYGDYGANKEIALEIRPFPTRIHAEAR